MPEDCHRLYNLFLPLLRPFSGRRTAAYLMELDERLCNRSASFTGLLDDPL